ncbi:enoyl-CoA hydratase/isomerase family protein [Pacificimonas sp. WHA3]|uniref:Enoyl-CoA hydratase/isomerase family protein n=1 Tax=Pacificimonas pallii TaxID=2827236 RepID=A0ABS6SE06_9SPHN|nr:enoyl-CoA hydratase-related protein [Pacificimonas pallii]MBV7256585.1 enoyl-CoA hydratase/isomerase family protein [Pacificimonas pallii]
MNDNIPASLPTSDVLLAEIDNHDVARLTMNRPERHNAFTPELIAALHAAFDAIARMKGIRAVVLKGEGRSFSAGADLGYMKEAGGWDEAENIADGQRLSDMLNAIYTCPVPTIAVAHGAVYGGGVGLIACADLAIAIQTAQFRLSEIRLGITPATISPFVIKAIGARHARRYFMTAEPFSAAEARRIGLVHRALTTSGDADQQIGEWIELLGEAAPGAVRDAKTLIMDYAGEEITDELRTDSANRIAARRADPEGKEGLTAFLEKRAPKW